MSTELHHEAHGTNGEPRHDTVAYEPRDVHVRTIYWYLFSLAVATILAFSAAVVILRATTKMVEDSDAPMLPMRKELTEQQRLARAYPPEPRLQGVPGHEDDPQQDLRDKIEADTVANEQLRWIDQNSGIAQIPVSEAMKLIVEKGVHGASAPAAKTAEPTKRASAAVKTN
ncbi:MAG TPA: hypothetical protein VE545_04310 [Candidatus Dormibacteraeota bacterium]|nr:hypothetical protein [Candidatus Dormibacteraeota bacterium]